MCCKVFLQAPARSFSLWLTNCYSTRFSGEQTGKRLPAPIRRRFVPAWFDVGNGAYPGPFSGLVERDSLPARRRRAGFSSMELHFPPTALPLWLTDRTDAIFCGEQTRKVVKGLIRRRFVRTWFTPSPGTDAVVNSTFLQHVNHIGRSHLTPFFRPAANCSRDNRCVCRRFSISPRNRRNPLYVVQNI